MKQKDKAKEFFERSIEEILDDYKNDKISLENAKVAWQISSGIYIILRLNGNPMEILDRALTQMK